MAQLVLPPAIGFTFTNAQIAASFGALMSGTNTKSNLWFASRQVPTGNNSTLSHYKSSSWFRRAVVCHKNNAFGVGAKGNALTVWSIAPNICTKPGLENNAAPPNPSFHRTCAKSRAGPVNSDVRTLVMRISQISNGTWGGLKVSLLGLLIGGLAVAMYSFCLLSKGIFIFLFLLGWATLMVGFVIHVRRMVCTDSKESREKIYAKAKQPWEP
jgi:hypothetical protein